MAAPPAVIELVARFERNEPTYRAAGYNETQVRREFIDPLFAALGWDVDNRQGYAEAYKDVIHEDAIKIGGATKAPDYCFRVGGRRVFFLEAKKPAVNLRDDIDPAYQLRRYAWSAKLPLSILTDFEELAVYDCRIKPEVADKASTARVLILRYTQFDERWDELAGIFSRDAVLKGSFDKFVEGTRLKRGTAEVDAAFLHEIEGWRELLARNFALRNPQLSVRELNFAVERTIDRLIFLRMCEDRGVEDYGRLQSLGNGEACYRRLCELFRQADERYNSGLFHFEPEKDRAEPPDELTTGLALDDKPLKEIVRQLYYPESPYEFSVLPAEILGQVYEQFLGKVIRLTPGHRAVVEDKPEVKKAGGVYYTPAYIVDYIVRQTVGKLVEGQTPKQAARLRVLDPACGSGSFLVGAYTFLLDWHRDWYVQDGPAKHTKEIYQGRGAQWYLTTAEKKRILLNNIYGVDIDTQAVEVTKLSLLLKVLEGENRETLQRQQRFLHERALPDLGSNIKCGNSLIGPEFYKDRQMSMLDEEEQYRINAFDWQAEFVSIFKGKNGGFDAVIGNPPYIRIHRIGHEEADYLYLKYKSPTSKTDLSLLFLERALGLLSSDGRAAFICTSQWLATDYGRKLRAMLADGRLNEIVDFGSLPVFENVSTYPAIFTLSPVTGPTVKVKRIRSREEMNLQAINGAPTVSIATSGLSDAPWNLGRLDLNAILTRGQLPCVELQDFGRAYIGTKSGCAAAFVLSSEAKRDLGIEDAIVYPYAYRGEEIACYSTVMPRAWILYPYSEGHGGKPVLIPETELARKYPHAYAHLKLHKEVLRQRMDSRRHYATGADWYRHLRPGSFQ